MQKNKRTNKKYSPEFKISVILNMIEENLSRSETVRRYWGTTTKEEASKYRSTVLKWERKYLKEGKDGFYVENRGKETKMDNPKKGRPRKRILDEQNQKDLILENQRLRMENEYLKKLNALVQERIERESGKKQK